MGELRRREIMGSGRGKELAIVSTVVILALIAVFFVARQTAQPSDPGQAELQRRMSSVVDREQFLDRLEERMNKRETEFGEHTKPMDHREQMDNERDQREVSREAREQKREEMEKQRETDYQQEFLEAGQREQREQGR